MFENHRENGNLRIAAAVFLAAGMLYVWTMPVSLPAYRDAGEMASSAHTLGVSHPPSYPLYILLGRLTQTLPLGTPAYRLTLLSAFACAAALAALALVLAPRLGRLPAVGAAALLGADRTFWSVAVVPEMYSLMLLSAALLLALAWSLHERYDERAWFAFVFAYGLSLGNRTDLLLWAPGLALLALGPGAEETRRGRGKFSLRWLAGTFAFAALGLSVYLYLPLRSRQGPWLDWNHPATLHNLIGSLTRRGYGGTLDLLSKNYAPGSMFLDNLRVYTAHLWSDFLGPGLVLPIVGWASWVRRQPRVAGALTLCHAAAGPVFLFLANMPPNPHALAIVEPHYLLPDLLTAVWTAEGVSWGLRKTGGARWWILALAALAAAPFAWGRWSRVDRRWDLVNYDYCHDVLRGLPADAVLIAKKDVQLFSLWYYRTVEGLRPDVRLVAQGLAASPWYQNSHRRSGGALALGRLSDAEDFRRFLQRNGPGVYATTDVEFPSGMPLGPPLALAVPLSTSAVPVEAAWRFLRRRGDRRYERQGDFFNSDLVEAYAAAHQRLGSHYADRGAWEDSLRHLRLAWSGKWLLPEAPSFIGFVLFRMGRPFEAVRVYEAALASFGRVLELTQRYRSLPDLVRSVRRGKAEAHLNLGVVLEKTGDRAGAERQYLQALSLQPDSDQARYNLAVLHWGRDWDRVIAELSEALRINPANAAAAKYLEAARQRRGK